MLCEEAKLGHAVRGKSANWETAFSRDFKKKGSIHLSTYLRQYKVGDVVDVVANGAVQKGMVSHIFPNEPLHLSV